MKQSPERVMIISKFFYRRGGAEVHAIELERLLAAEGLPTAVFAMDHPLNTVPAGALFTAPPVTIEGSLPDKIRGALRVMGGTGIKASFSHAIDAFRPTVVWLHNIHSYLSPAVAEIASKRGIRTIWTLHDYKLLCPTYSFLRDGKECRECISSPGPVLTHRCMKNSYAASALAYAEALRWNRGQLIRKVDHFICPSHFMAARMTDGGTPAEKLTVIHNFLTTTTGDVNDSGRKGVCYIGRLSPEKGIETLLRSAEGKSWHLTVAGSGPLEKRLHKEYGNAPNITFAGHLEAEGIMTLLGQSAVAVVPSECDENCSLSIIEALCCGTPVVASATGGNPELVTPGRGMLFKRGDAEDLGNAIERQLSLRVNHRCIAADASEHFSPATYIRRVLKLISQDPTD